MSTLGFEYELDTEDPSDPFHRFTGSDDSDTMNSLGDIASKLKSSKLGIVVSGLEGEDFIALGNIKKYKADYINIYGGYGEDVLMSQVAGDTWITYNGGSGDDSLYLAGKAKDWKIVEKGTEEWDEGEEEYVKLKHKKYGYASIYDDIELICFGKTPSDKSGGEGSFKAASFEMLYDSSAKKMSDLIGSDSYQSKYWGAFLA